MEVNSFLSASLPQNNRVFITVELETDHEDFRRAVRERRNREKGELVQALRIVFFDAKQFGNYVQQEGLIDLVLKPCAPVPKYNGVLAVDLGNTSTTSAAMSESDPVYKSNYVKLVSLDADADLGGEPKPLPSVLRIDQITSCVDVPEGMRTFPALPGDDRPSAVTFVAGELATAGAADGELPSGVVFGAKQLLASRASVANDPSDPNAEPRASTIPMAVLHARPNAVAQIEAVEILSRVPGELLFTHSIRGFRRAACSWPADLVLTYPTTYGPLELRQLTQAAARGWLRALGQPQDLSLAFDPNEDPQLEQLGTAVREWLGNHQGPCPLIGLTLDEATAAAFFHLYRRVFEQPGGLVRFRYLYPGGLRLLLIDCGGGTTDVALVHATSPATTPTLLEIDVLARTGMRGFGGDSITREICRLLKAKLQCLLARTRPGISGLPAPLPVTGPNNNKQAAELVEAFIQKSSHLDRADELVPTRFNPRSADPSNLLRRTCLQSLWQLAEAIKFALAKSAKPVKVKDLNLGALIGKDTSPLIATISRSIPQANLNQFIAQLSDLSFAQWEIDAMVRGPIEMIMKRCNRLIQKHLLTGPAGEEEVDWVVISGNGAQYPLIKRLAEEMLTVAEARDCITLDSQNLKTAVAKGAAMARRVERVPRTLGIKFNRHLSELLPFDVGYHNMITNSSEPLFNEYTPYSRLAATPKKVRLIASGGINGQLGSTFVLERRFPGDDKYEQYTAHHFPHGISGELEVRYDPTTGEFQVTDLRSGQIGECKDLTENDQLSPAMRGDI